jgi:spore coat protein CotH
VANRVYYYGANDSFVRAFWSQRVDLPQVVTEMAAQTLMLNVDRCTKNHVYARLRATDTWRVVPLDLEDAFATDSRDGYRNCAAEGYPCKDAYCYLSCSSFNSGAPLRC